MEASIGFALGRHALVKRLLGAGAAVDQANINGTTPLSIAPKSGHTEAIAALLGAGAAVG